MRRSHFTALSVFILCGQVACAGTAHDASPNSSSQEGDGSDLLGGGAMNGQFPVATIPAVIRDFRFYSPLDAMTNPDFEDPPYGQDPNGQPSFGYDGPWDDHDIVAGTLGDDGKPVYKNAGSRTVTTHGQGSFDQWYRDTLGTNRHVVFPLPLVRNETGQLQFDSELQGVPYGPTVPDIGSGFFPIDDGSPHATPFGNQGRAHNYSFTVEIHTVFTYRGGETFSFRGDDDVFVFINGALVINLGGVHGPEPMQVSVDSLNLVRGQTYPLDFFSAERHVTGSNIEFQTTLDLKPVPTQ